MEQIDFHFNVNDRLFYACRLTAKVQGLGKSVAVWCDDRIRLADYDRLLWTFDDMSFIPHAMAGTPEAAEARVVMSTSADALPDSDVLLMLSESVPPDCSALFARFPRGVDIVSKKPAELAAARERYRTYRRGGWRLMNYDQKGR